MNGHDASSPERQGSEPTPGPGATPPEYTLKTDQLQVERKLFLFSLRENIRGRFLCITEERRGHREQIIIPAPGLPDINRIIQEMIKAAAELPSPSPTQPPTAPPEQQAGPPPHPGRKRGRRP